MHTMTAVVKHARNAGMHTPQAKSLLHLQTTWQMVDVSTGIPWQRTAYLSHVWHDDKLTKLTHGR